MRLQYACCISWLCLSHVAPKAFASVGRLVLLELIRLMGLQVLFNANPVSYTRSCPVAKLSDFASNVTPPGYKVPSASSLPGMVSPLTTCSGSRAHAQQESAPSLLLLSS